MQAKRLLLVGTGSLESTHIKYISFYGCLRRFPSSSCNGKIASVRYIYFSAGAQAVSTLNTSVDFLSPFDAVGRGRQQWMDRWTYQHSDQLDQIDEPQKNYYARSKVCLMHAFMLSSRRAGVFVAQAAGNHGPDIQLWNLTSCRTDRSYPGSLLLGNGQKVGGVRRFIRHDVQLIMECI